MPAPPDRFRPRHRPFPVSPEDKKTAMLHRQEQRRLDVKLLTKARDRLVAEMKRLGIPLPDRYRDAEQDPVPCRLHGVPWTECQLCSPKKST